MLELRNLNFSYPSEETLFENLSWQVEPGQFVSLIGRSGCGKSSLFRLLNGLERPNSGKLLWSGKPLQAQEGVLAYMPQKDLLLPWRSVLDNVILPLDLKKVPKDEARHQGLALLEKLGLEAHAYKRPSELSGGMRQRISLARTLALGAPVLLLDEPFSALDAITRRGLCQWLKQLQAEYHKTILFITHSLEEACYLSDQVYLMEGKPVTTLQAFSPNSDVQAIEQVLDRMARGDF